MIGEGGVRPFNSPLFDLFDKWKIIIVHMSDSKESECQHNFGETSGDSQRRAMWYLSRLSGKKKI